ncbi:Hsp70 family protein, partial [Desulfuromonas acetoxidans]
IKITASSGLSDEEIEKMVKDAEMHSSEDKKKRELIEARNQADSLVYSTEKSLKDHGDKVDEETKGNIEKALEDLKKAMEGDDAEAINKAVEALAQASHKLAEAMYADAQQEAGAEGGAEEAAAGGDEDVVDAEFEEVDDDKKK